MTHSHISAEEGRPIMHENAEVLVSWPLLLCSAIHVPNKPHLTELATKSFHYRTLTQGSRSSVTYRRLPIFNPSLKPLPTSATFLILQQVSQALRVLRESKGKVRSLKAASATPPARCFIPCMSFHLLCILELSSEPPTSSVLANSECSVAYRL